MLIKFQCYLAVYTIVFKLTHDADISPKIHSKTNEYCKLSDTNNTDNTSITKLQILISHIQYFLPSYCYLLSILNNSLKIGYCMGGRNLHCFTWYYLDITAIICLKY